MRISPTDPKLSQSARDQIAAALAAGRRKKPETKPMTEPFEGIRYRSMAEANYAAKLTVICMDYTREYKSFRYEQIRLLVGMQGGKPYWYVPDFLVERRDGGIEFHEVKGCHKGRERGIAKFRAAQALYPWWKFVLVEA